MAKPQTSGKQAPKQKSAKDMIKTLQDQLFGEKNKTKKKELQTMIKKLELDIDLERKRRTEIENAKKAETVKQVIPVGVDPKDVQCINFLNGNCTKGDLCQFGHFIKKDEKKEPTAPVQAKQKVICRFLIDAINNGEYMVGWKCPMPNCEDIHKLVELSNNREVEVSLEEYIELQRQMPEMKETTPVTEETFKAWKAKKEKEDELHARRSAALKGAELFMKDPEAFEDDDEAGYEINYAERNYEEEEEEVQEKLAED